MDNKERFKDLILSVYRDGIADLYEFIENSDFFKAPASSIYHNNKEGGLCEHSLNVYDNLMKLVEDYGFKELIDEDSIIIASLCHDLAKIDFYEPTVRNIKKYSDNGSKTDNIGKFDWVSVEGYRVKESTKRDYTFGEHGITSFIIVNKYIKLTEPEAAAIINHHMSLDNGKVVSDISEIYNRYPLASMLHIADTIATYINENPYNE